MRVSEKVPPNGQSWPNSNGWCWARRLQGTSPQLFCRAHRGDPSAWFSSAHTRSCQGRCPVGVFSLVLPGPCAGEAAAINHKSVLQTGTTDPGRSHRVGVARDEAENAPRLTVAYGKDSKESGPPVKRRVETHTASAQDSSTPVPWRWRSRAARIRGRIDRHLEPPVDARDPRRAASGRRRYELIAIREGRDATPHPRGGGCVS